MGGIDTKKGGGGHGSHRIIPFGIHEQLPGCPFALAHPLVLAHLTHLGLSLPSGWALALLFLRGRLPLHALRVRIGMLHALPPSLG